MAGVYDEIEIEDMTFDEAKQTYYYPCPYVLGIHHAAPLSR